MGTLLFSFGIIISLCLSCSGDLIFPQKLILETPSLPAVWHAAPILGYVVEWMDEGGEIATQYFQGNTSIQISVPRGVSQYIVATPLIKGCGPVRPAGFLYPHDIDYDPDPLNRFFLRAGRLSYESGYVVMVGRALIKLGKNPWQYPIEKLKTLNHERLRDPWGLCPSQVASDIAQGAFRIFSFPGQTIKVSLSSDRHWMPESPFITTFYENSQQIALVSKGLTYFFSEGECLVVKVEDTNTIRYLRMPCRFTEELQPFL